MFGLKTYLGWRVDFTQPAGAPALLPPDSVSWRVFKNPLALAIGGVAAVLLEFAEPRIRTGVWEHSTFRTDPIGRSKRTALAAMIGVYAPAEVARGVIAGVTRMHAHVEGKTPTGEAYRALDPELLDWVAATATFGFLAAYTEFAAPLSTAERGAFYAEAAPVAALYGARNMPASDADFHAMLGARAARFEPHPIVGEFLHTIERRLGAALARAAVSILPEGVRDTLQLSRYKLTPLDRTLLKAACGLAERLALPGTPATQACKRLGLPGDYLYRKRAP